MCFVGFAAFGLLDLITGGAIRCTIRVPNDVKVKYFYGNVLPETCFNGWN